LERFKNLRYLYLDTTDTDGDVLKLLTTLPKLEYLDITGCDRIKDKDIQLLSKMPALEYMSLYNVHITDESVDALAAIPNLARIDIYGTKISDEGVARLRQAKPNLQIRHKMADQISHRAAE
jgi:hypothetical protein